AGVSPEVRVTVQVAAGNQNTSVGIWGVSEDYPGIRAWRFRSGDNFTADHVRAASKVCLLGSTTATSLFGKDVDPVGEVIRIKNVPFVVIGWLAPKGSNAWGQDQDDLILIPYTSALRRLTGETRFRAFSVRVEQAESILDVTAQLSDLLRQRHGIL